MNRMVLAQQLRNEAPAAGAAISLAGVEAVCDPSGALFLPSFDLLCVSDLHLEKGAAFARRRQLSRGGLVDSAGVPQAVRHE